MGVKLGKGEIPNGHTKEDFECFGPVAIKDGAFEGTMIADLGCFTQDGKDSNKFYSACVTKSKKTGSWFAYFEWGRTGATKPDFQFVECDDEQDAKDEYCAQLHSKNDKRGEWTTIAGIKTLRAKAGKDCYLVRPQATRSTGLPSGKTIKVTDGVKPTAAPTKTATAKPAAKKSSEPALDPQTRSLLHDMNVATVSYTKGAIASSSLPTQATIDEGYTILGEARRIVKQVGDNIQAQVNHKDLKELTNMLYGKIGKPKPVGAGPETWVLNTNNILGWESDLSVFSSALSATIDEQEEVTNPLAAMGVEMSWLDPKSVLGAIISKWAPNATRNVHGYIGNMKIHNMWKVHRTPDEARFQAAQDQFIKEGVRDPERALHQRIDRIDVNRRNEYEKSNTALLFHGTRSVNVPGILRKSLVMPNQLVGVVLTGQMFGPGAYFADDWKKSAGYTSMSGGLYSSGDGSVRGRHAFMFLVDVVLGQPYVAPGSGGYTSAPKGHHCVFGKANRSGVQNNEWIVYQNRQYVLRYLLEFSTGR